MKEQVISRAELDSAEAQVESIKARIALAQQQIEVAQSQVNAQRTDLDDMVVRAPFDGVAISKDAQPGEMISPVSAGGGFTRTGIGTIVDMSSLEIEVDVNESHQCVGAGSRWRPCSTPIRIGGSRRTSSRRCQSADRQKATVQGPDRVREARSPDPARHGGEGVVPCRADGRTAEEPQRHGMVVPKRRCATDGQGISGLRGTRRSRRTPGRQGRRPEDDGQIEIASGLTPGSGSSSRDPRRSPTEHA